VKSKMNGQIKKGKNQACSHSKISKFCFCLLAQNQKSFHLSQNGGKVCFKFQEKSSAVLLHLL